MPGGCSTKWERADTAMTMDELATILGDALDDERKAEAFYAVVIAKFGAVRPFINIIEAERRHAAALLRQFDRLGLPVPPNRWLGRLAPPETLRDACAAAIAAEQENIALYDRLLPRIDDAAVAQVLGNLQRASRENHLPAFQRWLARHDERT
jgi:rubrerythrin